MVAEQRGGLLGKLRAQGDPLLGQPADQLGIENVGGFERLTGIEHFADQLGFGFRVGLLRARGGELRIESPSCCAESVVLFGPTSRLELRAERLHLGFGVGDLLAQVVDFAGSHWPAARA